MTSWEGAEIPQLQRFLSEWSTRGAGASLLSFWQHCDITSSLLQQSQHSEQQQQQQPQPQGVLALDARVKLRAPAVGEASRLAICPYPAELEESLVLDGQTLLVRPIRPQDGQRLLDFYAQADPADMRLRFFFTRREVPHSEIARYSQIDYDREMTFVALVHDAQGKAHIAAEVSALSDPDHLHAQFAIQVAAAWQDHGLGQRMLGKLIAYLRSRGTRELNGLCLNENTGMAALARSLGFTVSARSIASDTVSMTLTL